MELSVRPMDIDTQTLGNILAESGYFADVRGAAQAIVKVLAGREMGFGPITSMNGIHIIKGKPSIGASLIAAAIKRSGRYDYRVLELTGEVCRLEFCQNGELLGISEFTKEDATLAGTQNMAKYARNMLFARAISNGAKWYCPDVFGGPIYTPEEMGLRVDGDGDVIEYDEALSPVEPAAPNNGKAKITADYWARPMEPARLKEAFEFQLERQGLVNDPSATVKQKGLLVGKLNEMFERESDPDAFRHTLLKEMWGNVSSKVLTQGQFQVLLEWACDDEDDTGDRPINAFATEEAYAVVTEAMREAGQLDLLNLELSNELLDEVSG